MILNDEYQGIISESNSAARGLRTYNSYGWDPRSENEHELRAALITDSLARRPGRRHTARSSCCCMSWAATPERFIHVGRYVFEASDKIAADGRCRRVVFSFPCLRGQIICYKYCFCHPGVFTAPPSLPPVSFSYSTLRSSY